MEITYLKLKGYRRFGLGAINDFEMVITSPLQLILGTNGSGKSSLLDQLTPNVPVPADFTKTGCKVIRISHNDKSYELASRFGQPHPHSFIVDGQELNDGGTITVQRELVKQHFLITQEIHNLLLGRENFTSMSPARRKEWSLRLCDTNFDYAIGVYNRLRERVRDVSGAIKIAKSTLTQESEKLLQDEEVKKLQQDIEKLHAFLNTLLEIRKPVESDVDVLSLKQEALDRDLFQAAKFLGSVHERVKGITHSLEDYDLLISQSQEELVRASALVDQISAEYHDNDKKIAVLKKADSQSMRDLELRCDELRVLLSSASANRIVAALTNPFETLTALQSIKLAAVNIFTEMPINEDKKFSQQRLIEAKEELVKLRTQRANAVENLQRHSAQVKHQENHRDNPDLSCPKCEHKFSLGYSAATLNGSIELVAKCDEKIAQLDVQIKSIEDYIAECGLYGSLYRQFFHLFSNDGLKPYFDWLLAEGFLATKTRSGPMALMQIEQDITRALEQNTYAKELEEKQALFASLQAIGSTDLQSLLQRNDELGLQIGKFTSDMQSAQRKKAVYQQEQSSLRTMLDYLAKVRAIIQLKRTLSKDVVETRRRQILNSLIRQLQSELAAKEQLVGTVTLQRGIVQNLADRIAELVKQEQDLQLLIKNLSPTEGLIAEGLLGFIKNSIDQINSIISKIWSYPLELQSCELIEGATIDLDYKFPFRINDSDELIADVSMGSTGIIEIINLAYRLTAMQYLGLQDFPLYLDEAGSTFDVTHRSEFGKMIRSIIEQNAFPQVFLISHYFELYGGLSNVETCVLSATNIATPAKYNSHVTIR